MRLRKRKPDYEHIAEMERDIAALPVPTLEERIEEARREARAKPCREIQNFFRWLRGFKWPVSDHDDIRPYVHATSYSLSAAQGFYPPRSRIVVATR